LAAFLKAYPFSNNRLILFAAPGIGAMTALGFQAIIERHGQRFRWLTPTLAIILIAPEAALMAYRVHTPWPQPDAAGVVEQVRRDMRPGDLVMSDEGNYCYLFFGSLRYLGDDDAPIRPDHPGQRVWFLQDHFTANRSRLFARLRFPESDWNLETEFLRTRSNAFLFVGR
jgi:hypothetical protein